MDIKKIKIGDIKKDYNFFIDTNNFLNQEFYYKTYRNLFIYSISHYKLRDQLVLIKTGDNKIFSMRISEAVVHMIIWYMFIVYKEKIHSKYIYQLHPFSMDVIVRILSNLIKERIDNTETNNVATVSKIAGKIIELLCEIADVYGVVSANTFSLYDIIKFSNRNKKFNDLINITLNSDEKIEVIEEFLLQKRKEMIDIFKEDKYNNIYPFLRSKSSMNEVQLSQMFVGVGTRATSSKVIISNPITKNFLHGLNNVGEYFIESVTARHVLIVKMLATPESGHMSKMMNINCLDTFINENINDCGSNNYLEINIKDQQSLNTFKGKYYLDKNKKLIPINSTDYYLIGKKIKIRSIITCALHPSKGVCKTCFGKYWKRVSGTRIGSLPAIKVCSPISNASMGLKHKLFTVSYKVTDNNILKYFNIVNDLFYIKKEYIGKIDIIIPVDLIKDTINNYEIDYSDNTLGTTVTVEDFKIRDNITGEIHLISNPGIYFSIIDDFIKNSRFIINNEDTKDCLLDLTDITEEDPILNKIVLTEEVSIFLKLFISLINGPKIQEVNTYSELVENILALIKNIGIREIIGFNIETIVYSMVRSINNDYIRPDFTKYDIPYKILSLSNSILKRDTVAPGIIFQNHIRQLTSYQTYVYKKKFSIFDILLHSS